MDFTPISINNYLALHLKNNPSANEAKLRSKLDRILSEFNEGIKCDCGNPLWVIGSALLGMGCYSCLTGEKLPTENFEIDIVVTEKTHFTEADAFTVNDWGEFDLSFLEEGNYNDDYGNRIDPNLYPTPRMCLSCKNFILKSQRVLCTLNKISQEVGEKFECGGFDPV